MKGAEAGQWTLLPGPRSIDRKTCPSSYCPLGSFTQGPFLGTGSEDTTANIKRLSSSFKPRIFCLHVEQGRQGASTCSGTPSVSAAAPHFTHTCKLHQERVQSRLAGSEATVVPRNLHAPGQTLGTHGNVTLYQEQRNCSFF